MSARTELILERIEELSRLIEQHGSDATEAQPLKEERSRLLSELHAINSTKKLLVE